MSRKIPGIAFVLLLSLGFISCQPRIYLPDRTNAPMLREAGEVKVTSSLKLQNNVNAPRTVLSPSFDFAASPIKGLGIIASYRGSNRYAQETDFFGYSSQDTIRYSGSRAEFGLGYYLPFGARGLFDLYGGVGFGTMERNNLMGYYGNYDARYYQVFLQPSIGFFAGEVFDMCGGVKINLHKYNGFLADTSTYRFEFTNPKVDITQPTFLMLGPFMNFNVGYKYTKFNMQVGANFGLGRQHLRVETPMYVSLGLTLAIAPRFWQRQKDSRR